ncbi:GNAT family N-acetyltransferase [Microcoleus sp. FACHB-SPT15]|uniref:GNAT family N-acetyltransferase n=1 Tax=Microcoleus sp. FACHB-SPT15 TaxID=2692830 RepID=UPI00177F2D49|nr:GNAT family N-acetyltransferase [Microcoleus sp. FACHB-SPT15]
MGILAFQGSEAIGFISFSTPNLGVSNCEWLGVRPSYRGQGAGKQLLAAWEQYAASHSSHCVTLICEDDNITFYRKNGFSVVGLIPQYCLGIDFHFLYKQIAEPSFV